MHLPQEIDYKIEKLLEKKKTISAKHPEEKRAYDLVASYKMQLEKARKNTRGILFYAGFYLVISAPFWGLISKSFEISIIEFLIYYPIFILFLVAFIRTNDTPKETPKAEDYEKAEKYTKILNQLESWIQSYKDEENKRLKEYVVREIHRIESTFEEISVLNNKIWFIPEREKTALRSSLNQLKKINPYDFEAYVGNIYEKMGYSIKMTPKSGDSGVDLVLEKKNQKFIVQCKRYNGTVSSSEVRAFLGTMVFHQAEYGKFVTTGKFSSNCYEFEDKFNIELVDGFELMKLSNTVVGKNELFNEIQKEKKDLISKRDAVSRRFLKEVVGDGYVNINHSIKTYIDNLQNDRNKVEKYSSKTDLQRKVSAIMEPIEGYKSTNTINFLQI